MKKTLYSFLIFIVFNSNAQSVAWLRTDSCSSIPANAFVSIENGDVFIQVNCDQQIAYANGIFSSPGKSIVRMSSDGGYKTSIGHFQHLTNFTVDNIGNTYIIGFDSLINNTYYSCCKFDSLGNLLWHFPIGTNYGISVSQTLLVSDGFVFGGDWVNYAGQFAGSFNLFIAKTDFDGNLKFLYKFDNNNSGSIDKIIQSSNNILVSGSGSSLSIKDSTTSIIVNGKYMAKYTMSGGLVSAKEISENAGMHTMTVDPSDNIIFGSSNTIGLFLYTYNDTGAFINSEQIATTGLASGVTELKYDSFNNIYFNAWFRDSLVLNSSQTFYSPSYGISNWILFRRNSFGLNDWSLFPECLSCGGKFDIFGECDLTVNVFYWDSIHIYGNNYYSPMGNILSRINCSVPTYIADAKVQQNLNISPNPSTGFFTINYENGSGTKVSIYNTLGVRVYTEQLSKPQGIWKHTIDLSNLSKGVYFVGVIADNKREIRKIILN